jgi:hypothetical protein
MSLLKAGIESMARVKAARDSLVAFAGVCTMNLTEELLAPNMACRPLHLSADRSHFNDMAICVNRDYGNDAIIRKEDEWRI